MISLQKYNESERIKTIGVALDQGKNVGIASDAGTPNLADPGAHVVNHFLSTGYEVRAIPGPSSVASAVSVSGILANQFMFGGFFPKKSSDALRAIETAQAGNIPLLFFETPKRIIKTLNWLKAETQVLHLTLSKELTKKFETHFSGTLDEVLEALGTKEIKGEWTMFIEFAKAPENGQMDTLIALMKTLDLSKSQTLKIGQVLLELPKNKLYKAIHSFDA
ncbi:MAG: 16S rRNA (cytidine1402-2'-O)-methyltransferase [Candidatus Marinamargulisbacteria bacterium]|jgi:16S rRNA (cytidine1402-2'-O)-methyltransferase